jgi:hypothetical protein
VGTPAPLVLAVKQAVQPKENADGGHQLPLVPPLPASSKNLKISFLKGVGVAAGFLVLFVVVAAVTHGVGVLPMLWGGLTLMSSVTGGSIGSASALAFLGLGGGLKAGWDKYVKPKKVSPLPFLDAPRLSVPEDPDNASSVSASTPTN